MASSSAPGDTRWDVVYCAPSSKRKLDGFLILRFVTPVVRKLFLYDLACSTLLAHRLFGKFERIGVGDTLSFGTGHLVSVGALVGDVSSGASASPPSSIAPVTRPSSRAVSSTSHSFLRDRVSTARVGTRWSVLYTRHPNKKFKRTLDGFLQLAQKNQQQQKVVLFDNEGTQIDQQFLRGGEEITCGITLQFGLASVEVIEIKEDRSSPAEGENPRKCLQSRRGSTGSVPRLPFKERRLMNVGSRMHCMGRLRNTSMTSIQPKRRDSAQVLNLLKRPTGTTNYSSCEQLEKEGTIMLSSVSRLPSEEERSASRESVDNSLKLNIAKACPEESADEGVDTEHGVVQYKSRFDNHRRRVLDNLDIQYDTSVEQNGPEVGMVEREASPHMGKGPSMRFGKRSIEPFKSPQTNVALVANQCLPIKHLSLDFQVDVPAIMRRKVTIPDEFNSLANYQNIMFSAIIEELNIILYDLAKRFGTANNELSRISGSTPSCEHGATELKRQVKDGRNNGRLFFSCKSKACKYFSWADESGKLGGVTSSGDDLEQRYDCCNLEFYSDCEVLMRSKKTWGKPIGENASNRVTVVSEKISVLLKLGRVKRFANYSKDDIWVIGSNSNFCKIRSDDFLAVAVSKWCGASPEGVIELELLGQQPRQLKGLFALHDRGVATELKMLDVIRSLHPSGVPLLPLLLCSKQPDGPDSLRTTVGEGFTPSGKEGLEYTVNMRMDATLSRFKLNSDQANVLRTVGKWFASNGSGGARVKLQHPELCLVHGTFGSGKSFLLVVLVIFIAELLEIVEDSTSKILISAATNVAVDRILVGLLEHGFSQFTRVGTLENISKSILPYSVYTITQSHGEKERIQELQQMIKKESIPTSRQVLEEELRNIKEGRTAKRREKLMSMRVVGVTCHSCTNPVLEGQKFTICILDECSQMPEPLSLLPLGGCTKLIAVGDPAQLPPTLSHFGAEWEDELSIITEKSPLDDMNTQTLHCGHVEPRKMPSDLRRALFVRLAKVYKPILLRTQYRCHPRLTAVPNSLFYEDKLINGCREIDRPPLVQGLPPLLFCDTGRKGFEKKDGLGFKNEYEADLVSQIITYLVSQGIPGVQIGVIVFYKSQAMLVQHTLRQIFPSDTAALSNASKIGHENNAFVDVQVSTVDAFQGMEKSIILLSCCRTNGLGFVTSSNRLNVALTRARHHLIIVGKAENLHNNTYWKKLLSSVRSSPGSYKPAQDFVAFLSANRKEGFYTTSHLGTESIGRDNCNIQEVSVRNEASSTARSSQAKSAGLVDYCHCSEEVKSILDDIRFRAQDFWEGYKLYCFGHYSHCDLSKEQFLASKMGRVVVLLQKEIVRWGAKFDATVRHVWVMMEEYLKIRYDKDCTNLRRLDASPLLLIRVHSSIADTYPQEILNIFRASRALLEEFEDEEELSTSENGLLLLQLVKDDAQGTEHLYNQAHSVQLQSTDIFDQFWRRLNQVDSNLSNLLKSSGVNGDLDCHNLGE